MTFYYSGWGGSGGGGGGGGVTAVTGTAPVTSTGGTTPAIGVGAASGAARGTMSIADFNKLVGIGAGATVASATAGDGILQGGTAVDPTFEVQSAFGTLTPTPGNLEVSSSVLLSISDAQATATAAQADIDAFEATKGAVSGIAALDANSRVVQGSAKKRGVYVSVTTSQTLGTTQPLSIADATMAGLSAGGSTTGAGSDGVVAFSFSASATETGSGAGQAKLGGNTPLADSAYAGVRIPAEIRKASGNDITIADILLVTTGLDLNAPIYCYLSYRSDLGANLKWRLWFYYKSASGVETAVTPTISITNAQIFAPIVYYSADVPLASDFADSSLAAGERAAENAPGSITTAMLADLAVTAAKIANATITDTQVAAANKSGTQATESLRQIFTGTPTTLTPNDSASAGNGVTGAAGNHAHAMAAIPGSGAELQARSSASVYQAVTRAVVDTGNIALSAESSAADPAALAGAVKLCGVQPAAGTDWPIHFRSIPNLGSGQRPIPSVTTRAVAMQLPLSSTSETNFMVNTDSGGGTLSTPAVADTSEYTRRIRSRAATGAGAGSSARFRMTQNWSRNTGYDAFFLDNGWSLLAANSRGAFAMYNTTIGNVEPDTLTNIVCVGFKTTDTNLHIYHNDASGTCTDVDLGANYPVSTTARYFARIYSEKGGSQIMVYVVRLDVAFSVSTKLTTNLPVAATLVSPNVWINNGATASSSEVESCGRIVESERQAA